MVEAWANGRKVFLLKMAGSTKEAEALAKPEFELIGVDLADVKAESVSYAWVHPGPITKKG